MIQKFLYGLSIIVLMVTASCQEKQLKTVAIKPIVEKQQPLINNYDNIGSLRFTKNNAPGQHEYTNIDKLPETFGTGEFTFELWIKPDNSFPVGKTPWPQDPFPSNPAEVDQWATNEAQLTNWTIDDEAPYSWMGWWWHGNWLLDGFSRNYGDRDGTFALQFYGGGRLRWLFDDGTGPSVDKGYLYSIGAYPATKTPSLLDGKWHNIQCVRRWTGDSKAALELWIDGDLVASIKVPKRVNLQEEFWKDWSGNPTGTKGWFMGGEEQACSGSRTDYNWNQFEDYKGLVDEMRFWDRAKSLEELKTNWQNAVGSNEKGLVGYYSFENLNTPGNFMVKEKLNGDPSQTMNLQKFGLINFSPENAPVK